MTQRLVGWAEELGVKESVVVPLWSAITQRLIPALIQLDQERSRSVVYRGECKA